MRLCKEIASGSMDIHLTEVFERIHVNQKGFGVLFEYWSLWKKTEHPKGFFK